ncbi:MAG: 1-acyl-sn-glycerol-3-phosphate acyltransferase [Actinomycetota bacterium]|nr:1-acyl-sn-glycerol-3-phosphate acyltransferase [Actinomycetota bacterium]
MVAANHLSHLDPPLLAVALRRPVRFLALDQLFGRNPVYDGVMLGFGAIPIPREGRAPLRALRTALGHLALGGVVGVFPEGRRVGSWGETEPRQGAAWLALRSDVPLLPVAISGTERSLGLGATRVRPAKVRMVLAEPMKPADYRRAPHPRAAMMDAWRARIDEHLVW